MAPRTNRIAPGTTNGPEVGGGVRPPHDRPSTGFLGVPLRFVVPGDPLPTQRPRASRNGHVYAEPRSLAYQRLVAARARQTMPAALRRSPLNGPVALRARFVRANRRRVDLDNLLKSILDGLTLARAWDDDSQVIDIAATIRVDASSPRVEVEVAPAHLVVSRLAWEDALEPLPPPVGGQEPEAAGLARADDLGEVTVYCTRRESR